MKNKLMPLVVKISAVALFAIFIVSAIPVLAALPTNVIDQLDRLQINVSAVHTLTFTIDSTIANTTTVTFNYNTDGFNLETATPSCAIAGGDTCTAATSESTDILTVTCTEATGCIGAVTLGTFTALNPSSAGSKDITVAGTGGYSGTYQIPILTDDTVTVTASITQTFVYDIMVAADNTSCDTAGTSSDYALDIGALTPGTANTATETICMKLSTNADEGAVVQVKSLYGALRNAAAGNYELSSATENLASDTTDYEGYGLCDASVNEWGVSGDIDSAAIFESACPSVGIVTISFTEIANTVTEPVSGGTVSAYYDAIILEVAALASTVSPSGDYTDDLTFRAYATF